MKLIKMILGIITMVFSVLGLMGKLPYEITNPISVVLLATINLINSIEYKNKKNMPLFYILFITSIFAYAIVFYILFISKLF